VKRTRESVVRLLVFFAFCQVLIAKVALFSRDTVIGTHEFDPTPSTAAQSNSDDDTTAVTRVYVSTLRPFWLSVRTCISADLKLVPLIEESLPRPSRRLQSPSRKYSHRLPNWMSARQLDSGLRWGYEMGCLWRVWCYRIDSSYKTCQPINLLLLRKR